MHNPEMRKQGKFLMPLPLVSKCSNTSFHSCIYGIYGPVFLFDQMVPPVQSDCKLDSLARKLFKLQGYMIFKNLLTHSQLQHYTETNNEVSFQAHYAQTGLVRHL
jgi:hypothetical protein